MIGGYIPCETQPVLSQGKRMPEPDETYIKNEISEISKTITAILKKVEQEREKFLPASTRDNPSESRNMPAK